MRITIDIDERLMADAVRVSGAKTKKEAVERGLRVLVAISRQADVGHLRGSVKWEGNLETLRADERPSPAPKSA